VQLSQKRFCDARDFIYKNAREIDKAIFRYIFEKGSKLDVFSELEKFQNPDGGFGKGIEPDFWLTDSSPAATAKALEYLYIADADISQGLVVDAIYYLIDSFNYEEGKWRATGSRVNDFPHAPWWEYNFSKKNCEAGLLSGWGIPNPSIAGYMNLYKEIVPYDFLKMINERAIGFINSIHELNRYDLIEYSKFYDLSPKKMKDLISDKYFYFIGKNIIISPEKWDKYETQPLMFVTDKESELVYVLKDSIDKNLDYIISRQKPDGCWEPEWSWGNGNETWHKAKEIWKGFQTFNSLRLLNMFGKIEEE